jgi:hypothetical protein
LLSQCQRTQYCEGVGSGEERPDTKGGRWARINE